MSNEAAAQTKATTPSSDKDLSDAIKRQVEFYFSRANLANDAFLVSQMNSQMYVPVETIVSFGKIKQLTSNAALVIEAIEDSKLVILNETKDAIKPNLKSERNTIILREIPSDTSPDQVQALFHDCGGDVTVRSDVGDTWFVTLESEDAAVKTLLELRNKTFNNAPIKARLKSENVLKSFFPAQTVDPAAAAAASGAYSRGYYAAAGNGYYDMAGSYGPQYASGPRGGAYSNGTGSRQSGGRGGQANRQNGGRGGAYANGASQSSKETRAKSNSFDQQQQQRPASRKAKDKKSKAAADKQTTPTPSAVAGVGSKKGGATAASTTSTAGGATPAERQPVLNSANFPPLPASDKPAGSPYGAIRHAYAHEDILEIVKHMDDDDCKLPHGKMDFEAHAVALTSVAHPDLLRNQRTYSIEQAREALRQGRPIRSDSIGSIDYESMMYGEDYTKEARELRKQKAETSSVPVDNKTAGAATAAPTAAAAQPKVVGYAAALIYGTPAPQPPVEAKKKTPTPAAAGAPSATGASTGAPGVKGAKTSKVAKGDEKKAPKKNKDQQTPVVDETLPKAGAWGGRAFVEVVKTEPVTPPPAPVTKASGTSPSATAKTVERKSIDGKWERNQKDRRPIGGDKP